MNTAPLPDHFALSLLKVASSFGADSERLLREALQSQWQASAKQLSSHQGDARNHALLGDLKYNRSDLITLMIYAVETTGHRALPLHTGLQIPFTKRGAFSYALLHSRSLIQALELTTRLYRPVIPNVQLQRQGQHLHITIKGQANLAQRRLESEWLFAGILNVVRKTSSNPIEGIELKLDYAAPPYSAAYKSILDCQVVFDQPERKLTLPLSPLEQAPVCEDEAIRQIYQSQCQAIALHLDKQLPVVEEGSLVHKVRRHLTQVLPRLPNLDTCASQFMMSPRTFRRHLDKQDSSYQAILDDVRCGLAQLYLRHPALNVSHTAELLGFHDTANFRRAFMRWTKQSPAKYRRVWEESQNPS